MMIKSDTDDALVDTFNSSLADLMDHGQVDHRECPDSHQDALHSQWKMGWRHVFTGHLPQEWEKLQGDVQTDKKTQKATNWASN